MTSQRQFVVLFEAESLVEDVPGGESVANFLHRVSSRIGLQSEYVLATRDGDVLPSDLLLHELPAGMELEILKRCHAVGVYCPSARSKYSEEEWLLRCDVAAAYRLCDHFNWNDTLYGHISARVPGEPENFLICPFGLLFSEVTASSLLKVNMETGEVVDQGTTSFTYNRAGYTIHSGILRGRPDINSVFHCHSIDGVAVSCMPSGLLPISQTSFVFGSVSYHDYEGIAVDTDERERLVSDLGTENRVLILRNHGLVTCGLSLPEAFFHMYMLNDACSIQVAALSAGSQEALEYPPSEIAEKTRRIAFAFNPEGIGIKEFNALRRNVLNRKDRSYMR